MNPLIRHIVCLGLAFAGLALQVRADEPLPAPTFTRFTGNPIIRPEMLPGRDGRNITGPSLIRVPEWLPNPLGRYYLYFGHHSGDYIRLAYADSLEGPWRIYEPGALNVTNVPAARNHIASPDVHVDNERKQIRMYFHAPSTRGGQQSFVATSADGLHFRPSDEVLGIFYFRVFPYGGYWYALAKGGELYRSKDGLTKFELGSNPFPAIPDQDRDHNKPGSVRHVALHPRGDTLDVYFTRIGDAPEAILRSRIDLRQDWKQWKTSEPQLILRPDMPYEGADLPAAPSKAGSVKGRVNALRDPAVFTEGDVLYLLYSVAGESGIAWAAEK